MVTKLITRPIDFPLIIGFVFFTTLLFSACNERNSDFRNDRAKDFSKTPVLFIHGRGMSSSSFNTIVKYMESQGYPKLLLRAIDLHPNDGPNIQAAENQIAPEVEKFLREVNSQIKQNGILVKQKDKIDIIAHSMGSVSSRWYIAKIRPDRVDTWISLAGPNHGSNIACPGPPGTGKEDLCPAYATSAEESYVQYKLNGDPRPDVDETPYGVGYDTDGVNRIPPDRETKIVYITIRTKPDEWIDPLSSPILDGAGGFDLSLPKTIPAVETSPGNILMLNKVGHDELLQDQHVLQLIYRTLNRE